MDIIFGSLILSSFASCSNFSPLVTSETPLNTTTPLQNIEHSTEEMQRLLVSSERGMQLTSRMPKRNHSLGQTTESLQEYMMSLPLYSVIISISKYFGFAVSLPGFITNPLTIYLSLKIKPQSKCELHMFLLGVNDLAVLSLRMTHRLINIWFPNDWSEFLCRIVYFVAHW